MNSPENWSGFEWVLALWSDIVINLLAATAPVFQALSASSLELAAVVAGAWGFLILIKLAEVGLMKGLITGVIMFLLLAYGLNKTTQSLPSGASIEMTEFQAAGFKITFGVHTILQNGLAKVLPANRIAGHIMPAQSAIDDAIGRSTALYEGSDLARLIRDYNTSCAPDRTEIAGPMNASRVENLHAVGLLGGGGLGIPADEIGRLAEMSTAGGGIWTFLTGFGGNMEGNGGWLSWRFGGGARIAAQEIRDLREIRRRREAGMAALRSSGAPFMGDRYALPTQSHWSAIFSGKSDATPTYLKISEIPGQKSQLVGQEHNATMFTPSSCAEAYQIAQLGAEQAYRALKAAGQTKMPDGQSVSAEAGTIAAASAWHRFLSQSLQKTSGLGSTNAELAGTMLTLGQLAKNFGSWVDLQTLLPAYVVISAWAYWSVLLAGPLFLLLAPLRGLEVIISWLALLLFPVICMVLAQLLIVSMSLLLASISFSQSAAASGWREVGADLDVIRGSLAMIASLLLMVVTWLASLLTRVNPGGLMGSMSGAVATATGTASLVGRVAGTVMAVNRLAALGGAARSAGAASARAVSSAGRSGAAPIVRTVVTNFTPPSPRRSPGGSSQIGPGAGALIPPKPKPGPNDKSGS